MIHPTPSDIPDTNHKILNTTRRNFSCFRRWFLHLSRSWSSIHLSYRGGKYSIERLIALDEYTQQHSLMHILFLCVASFLSAEFLIIAQEAVPLQDPALGWKANYGFWVRAAIVIAAVLYTIIVQAKYLLKNFTITWRQQLLIVIIVVVVQMMLTLTIAANICFPIPFAVITLVPAFHAVSIGSVCLVVGMSVIREVLKHREHLVRFSAFIAAQQLMALIYPAYQILFHATNDTSYELPVILLLPLIKLLVKNITLRCVTHLEDMMPESVIFTVDFFNALYTATCMESATSRSIVVIIVVIDIIQTASVLVCLHQRTNTVLTRLHAASGSDGNLLSAAWHLCRRTENELNRHNQQRIRIRSRLSYDISRESRQFLHRLELLPTNGKQQVYRRNSAPNVHEKLQKMHKVAHRAANISPAPDRDIILRYCKVNTSHMGVLQEALEVLFTTECQLLRTFLDAVVPLFYGIFVCIMVHFQSAKYHSELNGVTTETIGNVVGSIFFFSIVEFTVFGLLAGLIYRNLKINSLYQLAFVLETQTELIQSKLLAWITLTLAFRVVHFGFDFTFRFAWLATKNT